MKFAPESAYKIQAVLDLFRRYFPLTINGKNLETLIFQGGMAVDVSTSKLGLACARHGVAGTIALTMTKQEKKYKRLTLSEEEGIIGVNNLVATKCYEKHYTLGEEIGADFITSGAGINRDVMERIIGQKKFLTQSGKHYWTIPMCSNVDQLRGLIKRDVGRMALETTSAGGHNGKGVGFEQTLEEWKETLKNGLDKNGNEIIFAGGIRTPKDFVRVIDAGFNAVQIGTPYLPAKETNITNYHRGLVVYSRPGDVGNVASPAGLAGKGFVNEGIMKEILAGVSLKKPKCEDPARSKGCLRNCTRIGESAKAAGIEEPVGNYCIGQALSDVHRKNPKYGPLYFCGSHPEDLFYNRKLKDQGRVSLPAREITAGLLEGFFDETMAKTGLNDKHRSFLETRYKAHKGKGVEELRGMIFRG